MDKTLIFATTNQGKAREVRAMLPDWTILTLDEEIDGASLDACGVLAMLARDGVVVDMQVRRLACLGVRTRGGITIDSTFCEDTAPPNAIWKIVLDLACCGACAAGDAVLHVYDHAKMRHATAPSMRGLRKRRP